MSLIDRYLSYAVVYKFLKNFDVCAICIYFLEKVEVTNST